MAKSALAPLTTPVPPTTNGVNGGGSRPNSPLPLAPNIMNIVSGLWSRGRWKWAAAWRRDDQNLPVRHGSAAGCASQLDEWDDGNLGRGLRGTSENTAQV